MKSFWNKLLRIDLSTREIKIENIPDKIYETFLGGAGLSAYVLWKECPKGTTAFDPANRLTIAPGVIQGTRQTGAGKWTVGAISPSINMNADSACTASFGIEVKRTGFDAFIIHGRAEKPVYLVIEDDKVEIKDANEMWGKNAYDADDMIKSEVGDGFEVITIGQAGERLVRYAVIQTRKKSFVGRTGMGAVMGSKMLKGIAVKGSHSFEAHDSEELTRLSREINKKVAQADAAKDKYHQLRTSGTASITNIFADQGNLPVKNYQLGTHESGVAEFAPENYVTKLNAKPWPCQYCVLQCHNHVEIKEGPYAYSGKGPEYESYAMMGLNTMIDDVKAVSYAGELANMYGMDTISLGAIIAWVMECYEKGVITKEYAYGLDLKWGNADAMIELIKKIGTREAGLAYLLGEGSKIASEALGGGSEEWAVQMKGQEIAAHSWRAQYISALNYCTGCAAGPNHERGNSQHIWVGHVRLPEWGIDQVENEERWSWDKAADRQAKFHDYCNVINSAGHCKFMEFRGYTLTDLLNTINACTGFNWTIEDLRRCGDRITQLQKLLNIRYGWKKEDDFNYPKRFMEPVDKGVAAWKIPVGLDGAILDYYQERGWNENGIPQPEKLDEVGLTEFL
jgi:aldehyde:ferredoxin oxidoreductase